MAAAKCARENVLLQGTYKTCEHQLYKLYKSGNGARKQE